MSLADELLADLEGAGDDDEDLIEAVKQEDEIEEVTEEDAAMDTGGTTYDRITDVARLKESAKFKETMAKIKAAEEKPRDAVVAGL